MVKKTLKRIYTLRHILIDMAVKQFKEKYAGAKFGIWWTVITPLLLAISISFVFTQVFQIKVPNYTIFVLAGIIPWCFFSSALSEAMNSFLANSSTLKQAILPPEFIPVSCVLANLFNFLIGLIFLLPLFAIINYKIISLLPLLLIIVIFHFFFIAGLGLIFACLNIFFRDLSHFLVTGFMVWFWLTPVFYPFEMLGGIFRRVCLLNPMTYYTVSYQEILFRAKTPSPSVLLISAIIGFSFSLLGYIIFLNTKSAVLKNI